MFVKYVSQACVVVKGDSGRLDVITNFKTGFAVAHGVLVVLYPRPCGKNLDLKWSLYCDSRSSVFIEPIYRRMNAPIFHGFTTDFGNAQLFNEPFGKHVWVICFIDASE